MIEHSPLRPTRRKKYQELVSGTGNFQKKVPQLLDYIIILLIPERKNISRTGLSRVSIRLAESGSPGAEAGLRDRAVITMDPKF